MNANKILKELEPLVVLAERFTKAYHIAKERLEDVSTPSGSRKGLSKEASAALISNRRNRVRRNSVK